MSEGKHLVFSSLVLGEGEEWQLHGRGWVCLRVAEGVGYLRNHTGTTDVGVGHVIVVAGNHPVTLRASQLGVVRGQFFTVDPRMLTGVLSLVECQCLQNPAVPPKATCRCFAAEHEIAQLYARLSTENEAAGAGLRVRMLELFLRAVGEELRGAGGEPVMNCDARDRLRCLARGMAEADFLKFTLPKLAAELRCSHRHASRLFQECFGMSLRDKQTELRLQRAQQLLASSEVKVIEVAMECGFQSIGLFNAMFKRAFGTTPSTWRRRHATKDSKVRMPKSGGSHPHALLTRPGGVAGTSRCSGREPTVVRAAVGEALDLVAFD